VHYASDSLVEPADFIPFILDAFYARHVLMVHRDTVLSLTPSQTLEAACRQAWRQLAKPCIGLADSSEYGKAFMYMYVCDQLAKRRFLFSVGRLFLLGGVRW